MFGQKVIKKFGQNVIYTVLQGIKMLIYVIQNFGKVITGEGSF